MIGRDKQSMALGTLKNSGPNSAIMAAIISSIRLGAGV